MGTKMQSFKKQDSKVIKGRVIPASEIEKKKNTSIDVQTDNIKNQTH